MYHVFLDRFCRGEGNCTAREGQILDPDWENGTPVYAENPGDELDNNVFFGGNLWGVAEKLDYLKSLGVTVLYLSPVFESASNHRYDTGDYEKIDSLLGGEEAFRNLLFQAHRAGMRVILDGVFNHTGSDSRYFNAKGTYPGIGAAQSETSAYADWYCFKPDRSGYECWWEIKILPKLNPESAECRDYFAGRGGIAAKWLSEGVDGWRLDVADELSDAFLEELRETVKSETRGDGLILGEVWENAAEKIAYGKRRKYLWGGQLDSVMNYPFREAALALLRDRDPETCAAILSEIYATYPKESADCLMNLLGTHDTERILSILGDADVDCMSNAELAAFRLSEEQRKTAVQKLKIAAAMQYTVYGVPSLYYGDEAGMEGGRDPFCRMPFPWGREDADLTDYYRKLGRIRRERKVLARGDFRILTADETVIAYERADPEDPKEPLVFAANIGAEKRKIALAGEWKSLLTPARRIETDEVEIPPMSAQIWIPVPPGRKSGTRSERGRN